MMIFCLGASAQTLNKFGFTYFTLRGSSNMLSISVTVCGTAMHWLSVYVCLSVIQSAMNNEYYDLKRNKRFYSLQVWFGRFI